jgi:hypothetical protein
MLAGGTSAISMCYERELELMRSLIQSQIAQKPALQGEVGSRAWRVCDQTKEEVWANVGGAGSWVMGMYTPPKKAAFM